MITMVVTTLTTNTMLTTKISNEDENREGERVEAFGDVD